MCELNPDLGLARLHLAHLLGRKGQRVEAIQIPTTLLKEQPENAFAMEMLGAQYTKQGDYESAE